MTAPNPTGPSHGQRILIEACFRHGVPFFWRSPGTLLIAVAGAGHVLQDVASTGAEIVGLEGFRLDSAVHPQLDLIYDSDIAPTRDPITILEAWDRDIWVDVTLSMTRTGGR